MKKQVHLLLLIRNDQTTLSPTSGKEPISPSLMSGRVGVGLVVTLILLYILLPSSRLPAVARGNAVALTVPVAEVAGSEPVIFLRDLPGLAGLTDDADHFIIGGGFLYWAKCRTGGPAAQAAADRATTDAATAMAVDDGYLRRWPVGGGLPVTLSSIGFCTTDLWAADESGLYYWKDDALYRRSAAAPLTPVIVTTTARPASNLVVDGNLLYWAVGTGLWQVPKGQTWVQGGRDETETMAETGAVVSNLIVNEGRVVWSADDQIRSVDKGCVVECSVTLVANESGYHLSNANAKGPALGTVTSPHWVTGPYDLVNGIRYTGRDIRGYRCTDSALGQNCAAATLYSAPNRTDFSSVERAPTLGPLGTDGQFLFWIENLKICAPFCNVSSSGRLMKWRLNRTILDNDPFLAPQPIASRNSSGTFTIDGTSEIYSANGWVYFLTSKGISRIRADAPPLQWDIAFRAMEMTQGIQNLANQVPLVANKPTVVRVYQRKLTGPNLYGVPARLYGARDGVSLPGSPLRAANGALAITRTNANPDRMNVNDSWLFQLPDAWTNAGTIQLAVQIDPRNEVNDPSRANNSSGGQPFTFIGKAPICLVTVPVRTHAPAARHNDPSLFRMIDMMRKLVPTRDIWLFHQDNDVAQLEARIGIPPWKYTPYALPRTGEDVLNSLQERDLFSDDPDVCDDASAITHYVGLVHADTPTMEGNLESLGLGMRESTLPPTVSWIKLIQPWQFVGPDNANPRVGTLAHELTHNYGRLHINCNGPANTDAFYPYVDGRNTNCTLDDGRRNGVTLPAYERYYGFDLTTLQPISPDGTADFISYGAPYWVSDYTWKALFSQLTTIGALAQSVQAAQTDLTAATGVVYAFGVVDPAAQQATLDSLWRLPTTEMSQGMLRKAAYRVASAYAGQPATRNSTGTNYHLRLLDAAGLALDDRTVTLTEPHDPSANRPRTFGLTFPAPTGTVRRIELLDGDQLLASVDAGSSAPTVSILSPAGGETIHDAMTVAWQATDPDGSDRLSFTVQYSPDNGQHWRALLTNLPGQSATGLTTVELTALAGLTAADGSALIRVIASDGFHTTTAVSKPFGVTNRLPEPYIAAPGDQPIAAGEAIVVRGGATDAEDGGLADTALRWALDGAELGTGQQLTLEGLAPGDYSLMLTAMDGDGGETTASQTLTVAPLVIAQAATTPLLDGDCNDDAYANAAHVLLSPYGDGTQVTVLIVGDGDILYACFVGMARTTGTSTGTFAALHIDNDASGDSTPGSNDYVFYLNEGGVVTSYVGDGTNYAPIVGGAIGQVSATAELWHGELRIDSAILGGWNHLIGLAPEQIWVNSASDVYFWPHKAAHGKPATWGRALLGQLPMVTQLTPDSVATGAATQMVTIDGSGFAVGAQAIWNGMVRPTTVISSTRVQVAIPVADLTQPGINLLGVQNYGSAAAASNQRAFTVNNPVPAATNATLVGDQLTVNGANFVATSTILWNGVLLTPTAQSGTQLQAMLDADQVQAAEFAEIAIHNPGPGGGTSATITLASGTLEHRQFLPLVSR